MVDGLRIKLARDTATEKPGMAIIVMEAIRNCSEVIFNHREVVGKRSATHEHEVFEVPQRFFREFCLGLLDRQPAKVLPCPLGIWIIFTPWVEVLLRR